MKTYTNFKKIFLVRVFWLTYIFRIKFKIPILDLMLLPKNSVPFEGLYSSSSNISCVLGFEWTQIYKWNFDNPIYSCIQHRAFKPTLYLTFNFTHNVGLKTLLQEGISEPVLYADILFYKLDIIVRKLFSLITSNTILKRYKNCITK